MGYDLADTLGTSMMSTCYSIHPNCVLSVCTPLKRSAAQVVLQPAAQGAAEPLPVASMRLMASVAAAWAAQGFPEKELIQMTVARSKSLPEASRLPLLQRLLASLSSVSALFHITITWVSMAEYILRSSRLSGMVSPGDLAPFTFSGATGCWQ